MKLFSAGRRALQLGVVAVLAWLCSDRAQTQDLSLSPNNGSINLRSGFQPDPYARRVTAGGNIRTSKGGVTQWISSAADYRLNFTAGSLPLTIYAESGADTTLLINLPNGQWVANDDTNGLNPQLKFSNPQSGRYDIWVGTIGRDTAPATLFITELR